MHKIQRLPLSERASSQLADKSASLVSAVATAGPESIQKRSDALWKQMSASTHYTEIKQTLIEMNGSSGERCMYCEYNEAGHIDHFEPRSESPMKTFQWENLFLACERCNSNYKRDRFLEPEQGTMPIEPCGDDPQDHLHFLPSGQVKERTRRGSWSIELYGLKRRFLVEQRRDCWDALTMLIEKYAQSMDLNHTAEAHRVREVILRYPFKGVFTTLIKHAASPTASLLLPSQCLGALQRYPELSTWI